MLFSPLEITLLVMLPTAIAWYLGRESGARDVLNSMKVAFEDMPDFDVQIREVNDEDDARS